MFTSIAIIGRPNVGKSTLFNKLTNSRDAIVSDFPGLTKDRNYGFLKLKDKRALLVDTGGIAKDSDEIKEAISNQAWIAVEESEVVLFLLDGSESLSNLDFEIISKLRKLNKQYITILNKIDKKSDGLIKEDLKKKGVENYLEISAEHSKNLNKIKLELEKRSTEAQIESPEGKKVAILGRPNAGKSTFINNLINEDRLIAVSYTHLTLPTMS